MKDYPVPTGCIDEVSYSADDTYFALWAPSAEAVRLTIYPTGEGGVSDAQYAMSRTSEGRWMKHLKGRLAGKFYTFEVKVSGQWLGETTGIFCKATGVNGRRAAIIDIAKTNPEGWEGDRRPEQKDFSDIILYEMHHRDFSMGEDSGIKHKGKFLALTESGTCNPNGLATGIDHLKELGITHVHLLPSFDFASIDEKHPETSYNWGYDPLNYNVPEGSYSTDPYDPHVRIKEFKQMVMALHKAGLRVVLDVVYNHVYDVDASPFERTVPGYFFRHKGDGSLSNASGCGNEMASNMPMMRKYMVESILYWIDEYHIDGFRFDLMGVHDIETMNAIRLAIDEVEPSIFIYGEGWTASTPAFPYSKLALKSNLYKLPRMSAFGDELRDALRGEWTDDKEGAFLIGEPGYEESVKFGIVGAIRHPQIKYDAVNHTKTPWSNEPTQMISYVSCHDDMCLADRINTTLINKKRRRKQSDNPIQERVRLQKLAETVVLTSQGIPLIWCGDEFMRNKKGVRNSYNRPDSVNAILWSYKTEHNDVFEYVSRLVSMRKEHRAFRMGEADLVRANLKFIPTENNVVAYMLNGETVGDSWSTIVVILNAKRTFAKVEVPQGCYCVVCRDGVINHDGIAIFSGKSIKVPPQSALIMYK